MDAQLFESSVLVCMTGAQPKACNSSGFITVLAEINPNVAYKRHSQGWVDEIYDELDRVIDRVYNAKEKREVVSIAYVGNIVDLWQELDEEGIYVDMGSDQTSLHNPWSGGYYPVDFSYEEANLMMTDDPEGFKSAVRESLIRQTDNINKHTEKGTYFFDYGNAFLLEASRAGADIMSADGVTFRYPSYVQDIMGPMCFDYRFGPLRWVCASGKESDLEFTDNLAAAELETMMKNAPESIRLQLDDNIQWIKAARENKLVVGSQARILYADAEGRIRIAKVFNKAVTAGEIGPVILGRDHHDVSGTDSPFRETSDIYDGSSFTADMAIHNVIGDSFRGATWVSIHNGGGVGWGEVINGGFGLVLDGSAEAEKRLEQMLFFDVNNGIARRCWARNAGAHETAKREMGKSPGLEITLPFVADDALISRLF